MTDLAPERFPILSRQQLKRPDLPPWHWLWHGYLASRRLTLLTSQWKVGKTTLAAILLARMRAGGELAGLRVEPAKVVIVTEEDESDWDDRCARLDLNSHVMWMCRPFAGPPTLDDWLALVDKLRWLRQEHGADLVLLDPLAELLPARAEHDTAKMLSALRPLRALAQTGLAILMLHHPRKHHCADGQAARGVGALSAFADILIEMTWYQRGVDLDRRRRLQAYSRRPETTPQLIIELNADATDYLAHGNEEQETFQEEWKKVLQVLAPANTKLLARRHPQAMAARPTHAAAPDALSLAGAGRGGRTAAPRRRRHPRRPLLLLAAQPGSEMGRRSAEPRRPGAERYVPQHRAPRGCEVEWRARSVSDWRTSADLTRIDAATLAFGRHLATQNEEPRTENGEPRMRPDVVLGSPFSVLGSRFFIVRHIDNKLSM